MGNILREETLIKFGYDSDLLKPSSCRLVVWKCEQCGKISEKKFRDAKRINLCLLCSNKINANTNKDQKKEALRQWYRNNIHPLQGTKRPEHVIEAIRNRDTSYMKTDEYRQKISEMVSGEKNPFYGKKHSPETKVKMSKIQRKIVRRGKDCNFYGKVYHGKGTWYIKDDVKIWMRSSWEAKYAEFLDMNNINWLYEPHVFELELNDSQCTYRPDFYLTDEDMYVEIKGWWRDDAKEKYDCFVMQYPKIKIEVYMKSELQTMGVL